MWEVGRVREKRNRDEWKVWEILATCYSSRYRGSDTWAPRGPEDMIHKRWVATTGDWGSVAGRQYQQLVCASVCLHSLSLFCPMIHRHKR
jgi:hypothetical protein